MRIDNLCLPLHAVTYARQHAYLPCVRAITQYERSNANSNANSYTNTRVCVCVCVINADVSILRD